MQPQAEAIAATTPRAVTVHRHRQQQPTMEAIAVTALQADVVRRPRLPLQLLPAIGPRRRQSAEAVVLRRKAASERLSTHGLPAAVRRAALVAAAHMEADAEIQPIPTADIPVPQTIITQVQEVHIPLLRQAEAAEVADLAAAVRVAVAAAAVVAVDADFDSPAFNIYCETDS